MRDSLIVRLGMVMADFMPTDNKTQDTEEQVNMRVVIESIWELP